MTFIAPKLSPSKIPKAKIPKAKIPNAKTPKDENFPVAIFFTASLRQRVTAFYRYVRQADDIADSPHLSQDEKERMFKALETNLEQILEYKEDCVYAQTLMKAFRWDAQGIHITTWEDLERYCALSAVPVGRFLLNIHQEHAAYREAADALCTAHQILNHLQDYVSDMRVLGRCYFPNILREKYGVKYDDLMENSISHPPIQALIHECLARVDTLLVIAGLLPATLRSRRLKLHTFLTLHLAYRLRDKLLRASRSRRQPSPSHAHISLSWWDMVVGGLSAGFAMCPRPLRWQALTSCGSFGRIVACVPGRLGHVLSTFYMFCREVDDCADGPLPYNVKISILTAWKAYLSNPIGAPCPVPDLTHPLQHGLETGALPKNELINIIDGCLMDVQPGLFQPDPSLLDLYCRRVAGSVGCTVLSLLGLPSTKSVHTFAVTAGKALQYVNILRDIDADYAHGRMYLPHDLFSQISEGDTLSPQSAEFVMAVTRFMERTRQIFDDLEKQLAAFSRTEKKHMRLALLMIGFYWRIFCALSQGTAPGYMQTLYRVCIQTRFR